MLLLQGTQEGPRTDTKHSWGFPAEEPGSSLVAQWLGLWAFTAEGLGSIPGWGIKILQVTQCNQKKERRLRSTEHIFH